ncbi:uncharacterized protein [Dermacentor albipictus]|uniref:uncharacterized protein n=1 Tax=Dermacentor albipictus TaxID=60249 RepID=UPI0038FC0B92
MGSQGAALAAQPGRGIRSTEMPAQDYEMVVPHLPSGSSVLNTVFLHGDVTARPYRVEHFRDALARLSLLPDVVALGAYQMNHLWAVTFNSEGAKAKILQAEAFNVKDHRCVVIDPTNRGVRLKLFWLLHGVQDDDVRVALAAFGKVTEITRDKWRVKGCVDKASTTRSVTLKLKVGVTIEDLPHQLRVGEDVALVHVPGRAPLCLRCRGKGHIRRECRVPRCGLCRRFGHDESQCVRSYANVTGQARNDEVAEHIMDEADAVEATHGSEGNDAIKESTSKETAPAPLADTSQAGKDQTQPAVASKPAFLPEKADSVTAVSLVTTGQQGDNKEDADTEMPAASSVAVKRAHEDSDIQEPRLVGERGEEPPPKAPSTRRGPFKPKPKLPPERSTASALPPP